MSGIYTFFGRWISNFYGSTHSLGLAVLITVVVFRILLATMVNNYFKSPKLAEALQPRIDAINQKMGKDTKEANSEIMDLMNTIHYPYFGSVALLVLEIILCLLITNTVSGASTYITPLLGSSVQFSSKFLIIRDLNISAYSILKTSDFLNGGVYYIILPALAVAGQNFFDAYMRERTLVVRYNFDMFCLVVVAAFCFIMPQTFAYSWCLLLIGNVIHAIYANKMTSVTLVDKQISNNKMVKTIDKKLIKKQNKKKDN